MPYFKGVDGSLHFLSKEDVDNGFTSRLPPGCVEITDEEAYAIQNPPPSEAELSAVAMSQRDALLSAANEATAGMTDAYIADLLDAADTATFKAFVVYKLALNKITQQPGYPTTIAWPTSP